jgi:hypothetical protein
MIPILKRALASCIGLGLAAIGMGAAEPWQVVNVNRVLLEGTLKEGSDFEVRIELQEPKEASGNYFGASSHPRSVVSDIMLKVAGKKIAFPETAFADLANALLQTVSMTSQPSGDVKLRFTGGEGDASYEVEYFIQSGRLIQRSLSYFEAEATGAKARVIKTTTF